MEGHVAATWSTDVAARRTILDQARKCAALSKPWVLPPESQTPDQKLPETYQSLGARGTTNLEGRLLMALFPPDQSWFKLDLSATIKHNPQISTEAKRAVLDVLYLRELLIQGMLESAGTSDRKRRHRRGFRTQKRASLSQLLVTGDTLERLKDDYSLQVYRRDQYVTQRDSSGEVVYHITCEQIDPVAMTEEQYAKYALGNLIAREELMGQPYAARCKQLYTMVRWEQDSNRWHIIQEVDKKVINESDEPVSPYFCTAFNLSPGENYGRGFVEQYIGDFRSLDNIGERILDFAALCSKHLIFLDQGSVARPTDFAQPSGTVVLGRVSGGQVQDAAVFKADKFGDFRVVYETAERIRRDLAAAMLIEAEATPTGERVTATQVQRVAMELEGALGGVYAPIADDQQIPLLRRTIYQLERDKLMPPLPEKGIDIRALTGIAALASTSRTAGILQVADVLRNLGADALRYINIDVLVDVLARNQRVEEPGLIKTKEQIQEETQAALQAQAQAEANSKAIDVAGNVAEASLTPQGTGTN